MVSEVTWSRLNDMESQVDDLRRAVAALNHQIADLLALWALLAARDIPRDFGAPKYGNTAVKAQMSGRGRSDAPQSIEPLDHAPTTHQNRAVD